jgi:hypothetical protein
MGTQNLLPTKDTVGVWLASDEVRSVDEDVGHADAFAGKPDQA